jgi:hypothetical protein
MIDIAEVEDDQIVLAYEASDEALEGAAEASILGQNFTLSACTALTVCPGP